MATHVKVKVSEELSSNSESERESSVESELDDSLQPDDGENGSKSAMADVMAKILGKKSPENNRIILGKGKTDREIQRAKRKKEELENDVQKKKSKTSDDDDDDDDDDSDAEGSGQKALERRLWAEMGRVKPDVRNKDKERSLQRIATRGVVQLFNAVRKQQKIIEERLKDAGGSELRRGKVLKSVTKGDFLDMLAGTKDKATTIKKHKQPEKEILGEEPSWKILRDDFMMGATMKDWDKESDGEDKDSADSET